MNRSHRWTIAWAYGVEILLSLALTSTAAIWFTPQTLDAFWRQNNVVILATAGVLLGVTGGLFTIAVTLLTGQFGTWLRIQNADKVFLHAFRYSLITQLGVVVLLLITRFVPGTVPGVLAIFAWTYATVVFLTTIGTTFSLVTMSQTFNDLLRSAHESDRANAQPDEESTKT